MWMQPRTSLFKSSFTALSVLRNTDFMQSVPKRCINHSSDCNKAISKVDKEKKDLWALYNEVVYPPRDPIVHGSNVKRRPAEITHRKEVILASQKRLLLLCEKVRGLSVSDALVQLNYQDMAGARVLEDLIIEAVELAVRDHNVEFRTRLFIETFYVNRGPTVPVLHKSMRSRVHKKNFHYANVYLRLREIDEDFNELYHPNDIKNAWTPRFNCPAEGSRSWGSTEDMKLEELARLRSLAVKGNQ